MKPYTPTYPRPHTPREWAKERHCRPVKICQRGKRRCRRPSKLRKPCKLKAKKCEGIGNYYRQEMFGIAFYKQDGQMDAYCSFGRTWIGGPEAD